MTGNAKVARRATVLGGGAFGSALAEHLARKGTRVSMWVMEDEVRKQINTHHENRTFLPKVQLNPLITATNSVKEAVEGTEIVLLVIPTPFVRRWLHGNHHALPVGVPLVCCSKGIEMETLATPYEILEAEMPGKYHKYLAALSGPSFAREVAANNPTNVTLAAVDKTVAQTAQQILSDRNFRCYTADDVIGAELCGALKNVIAIAAGAADGFAFGSNGRAALISRGLAEMTRLIVKKGGRATTVMGLAGVGDLLLTCSSTMSRNYTVGYRLAKGETMQQIRSDTLAVAEGVKTSASVHQMAAAFQVDMPICNEVFEVVHRGKPIKTALATLQARPLRSEAETFEYIQRAKL